MWSVYAPGSCLRVLRSDGVSGAENAFCSSCGFAYWLHHCPEQEAFVRARAEAVREFVQWVATQRAYNGAGDPGQALYDYSLNAVLPKWAEEWLEGAE